MTILSASALDLDPHGCAVLEGAVSPPPGVPLRQWLRASVGFLGSMVLSITLMVALAN